MEKEVTQLSEETSETNPKKPKKERRLKRIFKGIKKRKKKILLIIVGLIIAGSIIGFVVYDQYNQRNNSQPIVFETQPEKLALKGWISSVYDGDTTKKPSVSIYNRVVKVTATLALSNNTTANLTTYDQVNLISHGSSYSPMTFSTITLTNNNQSFEFYFELNRDLMPEALIIKQSSIESPLEMLIDIKSNYYSKNSNLNLVFDDNTNKEYKELQDKFYALVADPSRLSVTKLPNIDLIIRTPSSVDISHNIQNIPMYPRGDGYMPSYNKCYTIDSSTLNPTNDSTNCDMYTVTYKVETDSKLLGMSRILTVYRNSYPQELIGTLDSHDSISEIAIHAMDQDLKLKEINSSGAKNHYTLIKADSGDIYVITTTKYPGYQVPVELVDLEEKLMIKVLESTKYELQEDIVEVTPSSKIPEETAPVSYAL